MLPRLTEPRSTHEISLIGLMIDGHDFIFCDPIVQDGDGQRLSNPEIFFLQFLGRTNPD